MLFHSWVFAFFLALVLAVHGAAPVRARRYVLLAASYVFYGWWDYRYTGLLLLSTAIDYFAAVAIARASLVPRRVLLTVSLSLNLGLLVLFKYWGFFARAVSPLGVRLPVADLLLPVGISFYTFQSMSYTIDVYRGYLKPARDFVDFALYVSFFPQLVAGPIVRAIDFLPQLERVPTRPPERLRLGIRVFFVGLAQKLLIADFLAGFVDRAWTSTSSFGGAELVIAAIAFSFQIYADFAGYSNMAIGLAHLLGYSLTPNFLHPYVSASPSEFWRRWHVSLSTWLRDYLYIPLGGSRGRPWQTARSLLVTMILGGLWHGANWTFLLWGLFHGLLLCLERLWRLRRVPPFTGGRRAVGIAFTFLTWTFSMILFRAPDLHSAIAFLRCIGAAPGHLRNDAVFCLLVCLVFFTVDAAAAAGRLPRFEELPPAMRTAAWAALLAALLLLAPGGERPFLYFQF